MEISATNDDGEYSLGVVEQVAHTVRKPRLFSRVQTSCLMSYYESGMKGTGEQYRALHERAAEETGLHVKQVVVSILNAAGDEVVVFLVELDQEKKLHSKAPQKRKEN